jgi:Signal peptidase, peptidase S26
MMMMKYSEGLRLSSSVSSRYFGTHSSYRIQCDHQQPRAMMITNDSVIRMKLRWLIMMRGNNNPSSSFVILRKQTTTTTATKNNAKNMNYKNDSNMKDSSNSKNYHRQYQNRTSSNMRMSILSTTTATTLLAMIPLLIWFRDSFFSVYRVQGTSMEPTLYHNEIVLVRKCDSGIITELIYDWFRSIMSFFASEQKISPSTTNHHDTTDIPRHPCSSTNHHHPYLSTRFILSSEEEQDCMIRNEYYYEQQQHPRPALSISNHHFASLPPRARFYEVPPTALPGHVILFYHPYSTSYPSHEISIKRVIGVGGQWVQIYHPPSSSSSSISLTIPSQHSKEGEDEKQQKQPTKDASYYGSNTMELLPVYSLYVEGDNRSTSFQYTEPILKNGGFIGIAEYILWSPVSYRRVLTRIVRQNSIDPITHEPRNRWL